MKFSKLSQLFLVSSIGLLVAILFTACSITTIDYVFVATANGIQTFAVDSESGALRIGAPTVSAGTSSPVAMAITSDYANLYVANAGNNTVVHYAVASDGVLTIKDTVTTAGTPVSLAVNTQGTFLYVVAGSGAPTLTEYALSSGTIGAATAQNTLALPGFTSDKLVPTGVAVLANDGSNIQGNAVYVTVWDQSAYNPSCIPTAPATTCPTSTANPGWVFGFTIGSGGALAASSNSPYQAGVRPSAITSDPTDRFVYVTDFASNQLIGYSILDGSTLSFLTAGPFKTGNEPSALVIDPRGKFLYVTNSLDHSISPFSITLANGEPTSAAANLPGDSTTTDTLPVSIVVDPALGRFVYTANNLGSSISGFLIDPTSGEMKATQATPYPTDSSPTALVMAPHGNHATQAVTP
jgi:6-phosphogluconolactonase (cycloisomerase 2 family)